MATREVTPVTLDIDGFPGAGVYRTGPAEYWPTYLGQIVGGMYRDVDEAEGPAIAAWVQAHPECQVTMDAETALQERADGYDAAAALEEARADLNYYGNSTTGMDEGRGIDFDDNDDAVYCEDCGAEIDPTDAVVVTRRGEGLCVCCDCATPGHAFTLARAGIFDALVSAYDGQATYWAHVPGRAKLIRDAFDWLVQQDAYSFDRDGNLLVPSLSEPGRVHRVGVSCDCTAGRWGRHCWHSAAADIIGRARRAHLMRRDIRDMRLVDDLYDAI